MDIPTYEMVIPSKTTSLDTRLFNTKLMFTIISYMNERPLTPDQRFQSETPTVRIEDALTASQQLDVLMRRIKASGGIEGSKESEAFYTYDEIEKRVYLALKDGDPAILATITRTEGLRELVRAAFVERKLRREKVAEIFKGEDEDHERYLLEKYGSTKGPIPFWRRFFRP